MAGRLPNRATFSTGCSKRRCGDAGSAHRARVDFDGNGRRAWDALPDAHFWLGIADAFVNATTKLNVAINAWTPSLEDSFTALATMIPTMGDYFQEWKGSAYVAGQDPRFVAQSRLVDVKGIATSLSVIYGNVATDVTGKDATLNQQIDSRLYRPAQASWTNLRRGTGRQEVHR